MALASRIVFYRQSPHYITWKVSVRFMDISRFMRVYSNLPLKLRGEIVAVIDEEPITWNVAYQEIGHGTEKGRKILEILIKLKII